MVAFAGRLLAAGCVVALALGACGCAGQEIGPQVAGPKAVTAAASRQRFVSPFSYEWFVRAELLEARGEHAAAAEAYRMALASSDEDAYLLARLAEALDQSGAPDAAERALHAVLALDPRSEAGWLAIARIAQRHGAFERAFEAYERAEAAAPSATEAPLALAALLREQGQPERAIAVLERMAARSSGTKGKQATVAALRARIELAVARGDGAALAEAGGEYLEHAADAELLRRLAGELWRAHRPALASHVLSALPEADRDARLRLDVALALEQHERAELLLASTAPDALGGPLEMAAAYLRVGRPALALALVQEQDAVDDPDPHLRSLLRGQALLALDRPSDAAAAFRAVPAGSAHGVAAHQGIARALEAAGLFELSREVSALQ